MEQKPKPRLLETYRKSIVPEMMSKNNYKSPMQVPRLKKIVINMGVGEGGHDIKILEKSMEELGIIVGQKPVITRAKKAISNFKVRKDMPVGCKVNLRRAMMYEFLDRLVNVALPRIKDFRGVSDKAFDQGGNYTLGISDQIIFPEIDADKVTRPQGMHITIVTNANTKQEAKQLLQLFGFPFRSQ